MQLAFYDSAAWEMYKHVTFSRHYVTIFLTPKAGVWARAFEADVRNIRCARQGILTTCT